VLGVAVPEKIAGPDRASDGTSKSSYEPVTLGEAKSTRGSRKNSLVAEIDLVKKKVSVWTERMLNLLPLVLLVTFVMLPSVSRSIFSSWDCVPYKSGPQANKNFLRRDYSVECGSGAHNDIVGLAIVLVLIWPVGMQLLFVGTLWSNRKELRSSIENSFTKALRFLSGGYKPQFFYWETIELFRRLTCSGFVVLIPHTHIFSRIIMALAVSIPILVATAVLKPFKNPEDTALSLASQTILVVAFGCSALIRIVTEEELTNRQKELLVGFFSSTGVFAVLAVCCLGFLILLLATYLYKINELFQRRIRRSDSDTAEASSAYLLVGASIGGLSAMTVGMISGPVLGIVLASIFFSIGGAAGSIVYSCTHKHVPTEERYTTTSQVATTPATPEVQAAGKDDTTSVV